MYDESSPLTSCERNGGRGGVASGVRRFGSHDGGRMARHPATRRDLTRPPPRRARPQCALVAAHLLSSVPNSIPPFHSNSYNPSNSSNQPDSSN